MYLCRWKWMNIRGEGGKLKKPSGFQKQRHGLDSFLPSPSSSSFFPHHAPRINYGMTMGKRLLRCLAVQLWPIDYYHYCPESTPPEKGIWRSEGKDKLEYIPYRVPFRLQHSSDNPLASAKDRDRRDWRMHSEQTKGRRGDSIEWEVFL